MTLIIPFWLICIGLLFLGWMLGIASVMAFGAWLHHRQRKQPVEQEPDEPNDAFVRDLAEAILEKQKGHQS